MAVNLSEVHTPNPCFMSLFERGTIVPPSPEGILEKCP